MAGAVTVTVPGTIITERVQATLTLLSPGGATVTLPITDPAATYANLAANWVEVARPGNTPLLVRAGFKLATVQVKATIAAPDGSPHDPAGGVESTIEQLLQIAKYDGATTPVAFTWGALAGSQSLTSTGHWHLDTLQIDSVLLQPRTNNISRASVSLTLKEASDVNLAANPYVGVPALPTQSGDASTSIREWTVSAGDTLYSIAAACYGSSEPGWRNIAANNEIANPAVLTVGQVLLIP